MFANLWAVVLGGLAIGLPIAVHFLTRPRPAVVPVSTLRFLREVVEQRRARSRLRDVLVLALRSAAVLLLAIAFARPLWNRTAAADPAEVASDVDVVRVVIVDASQSMAAVDDGVQRFESARIAAARWLEHQQGLRANLVLAAARPEAVFDEPAVNFEVLTERLAAATPRPERLLVAPALESAAAMLAAAPEEARRELVIVSDFQRSNWAVANFGTQPAGTTLHFESVAGEERPSNLGLVSVGVDERAEPGRETQLFANVANQSATARRVRVQVSFEETAYQLEGNCPANALTTLTTTIVPTRAGWLSGEATLVGNEDPLPADDSVPCVVRVHPPARLVMLTRQSRDQKPSSSWYVQRALAPTNPNAERADERPSGSERFVRTTEEDFATLATAAIDVLVVDHPGRLADETIGRIAGLLRRGTGVIYIAAERVDALNLAGLVDASGGAIRLPVEFEAPAADRPREGLFVTAIEEDQAPFVVFGDEFPARLAELRFAGGLVTRPAPGALAEDVFATYADGTAALLSSGSSGGAELVVLNAELNESDLGASPLFVPLMAELTERATSSSAADEVFPSGEPMTMSLPGATSSGLRVANATGGEVDARFLPTESGVVVQIAKAPRPGLHRVERDGSLVSTFATSIPEEESDLAALDETVIRERLAAGSDVRFRSVDQIDGDEGTDGSWPWFAVACIGCLLGELAVLKSFRT